jgi:hypothetical protein
VPEQDACSSQPSFNNQQLSCGACNVSLHHMASRGACKQMNRVKTSLLELVLCVHIEPERCPVTSRCKPPPNQALGCFARHRFQTQSSPFPHALLLLCKSALPAGHAGTAHGLKLAQNAEHGTQNIVPEHGTRMLKSSLQKHFVLFCWHFCASSRDAELSPSAKLTTL